jgi:hypothetical protein
MVRRPCWHWPWFLAEARVYLRALGKPDGGYKDGGNDWSGVLAVLPNMSQVDFDFSA